MLELYPIVVALNVWGAHFAQKSIVFHTGNLALVHIINKQSCKEKATMVLVRHLVLLCLHYNILFKAVHILGKLNTLSDLLSRQQIATFRKMAPWADHHPIEIPRVP